MAKMKAVDVVLESLRFLSDQRGCDEPTPEPTDAQVAEAQRLLGVKLPPSYLEFIDKAGLLMPCDWDLYWVGGPEMTVRRNIVVANEVERAHEDCPLPPHLIAFFDDGSTDQYCFDTRERELVDGEDPLEYPVLLWDRDQGPEQADKGVVYVADDFLDWAKRSIQECF